jgi:hypothetical protein
MQSRKKPAEIKRDASVHKKLERLGIRTYNNENPEGARQVFTRPKFKDAVVARLYQENICYLFGVLCRDEGSILSREDPALFDGEFDSLLEEFGPLIWPVQGEGSRDHLLQPQANSMYERELVYPRDAAM